MVFFLANNSTTPCSLSFVTDISLNSGHAFGSTGAVCSKEESSGSQNPRVNWLLRSIFWIFSLSNNSIIFCIPSIIILVAGWLFDSHSNMAYYNKLTWQNRFIHSRTSVLFTALLPILECQSKVSKNVGFKIQASSQSKTSPMAFYWIFLNAYEIGLDFSN